ncbi:hypothetical protein DM02DRAFT_160539 [Periconia macrospinosa]|uniref:Zn(2)-C6 fungal-type domain-containing protein n=1 Tax=Periconia macrospinosa TaxID=97972 RepID=A0A2V1E5V7_9PLEO|nr:hypothetical protein DM02DRAFT_160539 [Periconia macrospinosa]
MPETMTTPRRKACVECRQQKIRCDVEQHKTPHDPCNRCKRMGLECRILPTSTRNLRQTKAEMRRELEELRWNMRQAPASSLDGTNSAFHSPSAGTFSNPQSGDVTEASLSPAMGGTGSVNGGSAGGAGSRKGSQGQTLSRALDGYVVDAKRIDDCFALFFSQYHTLLPVLDSSMSPQSPNEFYDLSPFLFWVIIVTGSRQYHEDPSILDRISQLITPLAFSSMALRSTPIPVIQGLLILCTWRLPTNSMYKDMTHMLCGAAVHLATQIGLHVDGVGQDFARMPLKKDQEQKIFRAKIWMYCMIVSIRTSCAEGIPPLVIADTFFDGDEKEREDTLAYLPVSLQFNHKLHVILHKAMAAMARTDLKSVKCDVGILRSLIGVFDSQLLLLATTSPTKLDTFFLNCARIHILAFHFFAHPTHPGPDAESLSRLYSLCVSTLQTANLMVQQTSHAFISQSFIDRTIALAGFIILKLYRSPLAAHLNLNAGETAFSLAIQFTKATSMQNNDLASRCANILANLWGSSRVFRRKGGAVESLGLRLRTRLSMSLSFDMFWYWREEFGHMSNPYDKDEVAATSTGQTQSTTPGKFRDCLSVIAMVNVGHTDLPSEYQKEVREAQQNESSQQQLQQQPTQQQLQQQQQQLQHQQQLLQQQQQTSNPSSVPSTTSASIPNPAFMGHIPQTNAQTSAPVNFDAWDGSSEYSVPPMLDQFPDYDWAASFDFTNEWVQQPMQGIADSGGYQFG